MAEDAENETKAAEPNGVVTLRDAQILALARSPQLDIYPYDFLSTLLSESSFR
jgi:hypothetical protein